MMKQEKYEPAELEIINFLTKDVLLISDYEEDETPLIGNNN